MAQVDSNWEDHILSLPNGNSLVGCYDRLIAAEHHQLVLHFTNEPPINIEYLLTLLIHGKRYGKQFGIYCNVEVELKRLDILLKLRLGEDRIYPISASLTEDIQAFNHPYLTATEYTETWQLYPPNNNMVVEAETLISYPRVTINIPYTETEKTLLQVCRKYYLQLKPNYQETTHLINIFFTPQYNNTLRTTAIYILETGYLHIFSNILRKNITYNNLGYLNGITNYKNWKAKLSKLEKILHENRQLMVTFMDLSLAQELDVIGLINKLADKYQTPNKIIGIVENTYNKDVLQNISRLEEIIINELTMDDKLKVLPLVQPMRLPPNMQHRFGWRVVELYTREMLEEEGKYQRHCVGGYSQAIWQEGDRIFSFRKTMDKEVRYTIQYKLDGYKYIIGYFEGFGRHHPKNYNDSYSKITELDYSYINTLANDILKYLNTNLIGKYLNVIDDF